MQKYDNAFEGECSHKHEFHNLWEDGMCCPKVCFTYTDWDTDAKCDGGTNYDTT